MSNRQSRNQQPPNSPSRYQSYPTSSKSSSNARRREASDDAAQSLQPPFQSTEDVPVTEHRSSSSSVSKRESYNRDNRPNVSRTKYTPPKDLTSTLYDKLAEVTEKLSKYEAAEKETMYLESDEMRIGPMGALTSSDDSDNGGCRVYSSKRKPPNVRVGNESSPKKTKREERKRHSRYSDDDYAHPHRDSHHRHRRDHSRSRRRSRSCSPSTSKSKPQEYKYLSDSIPFDCYAQPVFNIMTEKPKTVPPDVILPPMYKDRPKKPIKLDPQTLDYEYVENYYAPFDLDSIPRGGIVNLSSRFDPLNKTGHSEYISSDPDPIDWATVSYDDYKSMNHMFRTMFFQSDPEKRATFYASALRSLDDDDADLWIEYIKTQVDLDEKRCYDGRQIGKTNVVAKQLAMLAVAKKKCSKKYDLELYEMDLLTAEGKLDDDEMEKRWDALVTRYVNNLTVWRRKIAAYKSSSKHSVNKILNRCYFRCLNKLGGLINGSIVSHKMLDGTEKFVLEVLQSAFALLIESGNIHKAVAILQAYVEFYFFEPPQLKSQFSRKLEVFERFWNGLDNKGGVRKVGTDGAKTWSGCTVTKDFTNYNQPDNYPADPSHEITNLVQKSVSVKTSIVKTDEWKSLPDSAKWARVEQARSNVIWQPSVCQLVNCGKYFTPLYVPFSEISDTLIYFSGNDLPLKAVFSMLIQLGAIIPGVEDLSERAMCDIAINELQVFNYEGLDVFFDNVLAALQPLSAALSLRCYVARLMTYTSFVIKKTTDYKEAVRLATLFFDKLMKTGTLNKYEKKALMAYFHEAVDKISHFYCKVNEIAQPMWSNFVSKDSDKLFKGELEAPVLLTDLRFAVTLCRIYPYAENKDNMENTKLSVLTEMSLSSLDDSTDFEKLRKLWNDAREVCFTKANGIAPEHSWIGNIKEYYTELLAILHYETETNPGDKWTAFKSCFTAETLNTSQYLTEVYYSTWFHYIQEYNTSKVLLMNQLKDAIKVFPLNVSLIRILAQCLPIDEIRTFFAEKALSDNINEVFNDRIRVLRAVVQFMPLRKIWQQGQVDSLDLEIRTQYFIDLVRNTAVAASQASIRPDSFLWRLLVYVSVFFGKRGDDITNIYVEARQHCLWSKEFLVYFHLKTCTKLLQSSIDEAEFVGQRICFGYLDFNTTPKF